MIEDKRPGEREIGRAGAILAIKSRPLVKCIPLSPNLLASRSPNLLSSLSHHANIGHQEQPQLGKDSERTLIAPGQLFGDGMGY